MISIQKTNSHVHTGFEPTTESITLSTDVSSSVEHIHKAAYILYKYECKHVHKCVCMCVSMYVQIASNLV